jgi:hypothetical protein
MSVKANVLVLAAVAALGVNLTAGAQPMVEGLINDYDVSAINIAQVDDAGRCIVIVTATNAAGVVQTRPVANSAGDVRIYADFGMTNSLIARAKLSAAAVVTYKRKVKAASLVKPLIALKQSYKAFKAENAVAVKAIAQINSDIISATAVGWNTAVGTPEAETFADYGVMLLTVTEQKDYTQARVTALAAALTAAGVDPLTVV